MTNEDFADWLQVEHSCIFEPIEGINVTGWSCKVVNPRLNRYAYMSGPFDGRPIPDVVVRKICYHLGVRYPDCVNVR